MLQQHLEGANEGRFVDGSLTWAKLAQGIRERVKDRLRLFYHTPLPFAVSIVHWLKYRAVPISSLRQLPELLRSFQRDPQTYHDIQEDVSKALVSPCYIPRGKTVTNL